MMETIIEESIWDIEQRLPVRRAVLRCDDKEITRNLFILGDEEWRNSKVDIINLETVEFPKDCFERNVNNEIPFFINPIITRLV